MRQGFPLSEVERMVRDGEIKEVSTDVRNWTLFDIENWTPRVK